MEKLQQISTRHLLLEALRAQVRNTCKSICTRKVRIRATSMIDNRFSAKIKRAKNNISIQNITRSVLALAWHPAWTRRTGQRQLIKTSAILTLQKTLSRILVFKTFHLCPATTMARSSKWYFNSPTIITQTLVISAATLTNSHNSIQHISMPCLQTITISPSSTLVPVSVPVLEEVELAPII